MTTDKTPAEAPEDYPVFICGVDKAARFIGLPRDTIDNAIHARPPLPHLKVGRVAYIHRDSMVPYFEKRCVGMYEMGS